MRSSSPRSITAFTALATVALTFGAACTPSSSGSGGNLSQSAGRGSVASGDGSGESTTAPPEPAPTFADSNPDTTVAPAPRPLVAARPVYVPPAAGPYRVHVVDEAHRDLPTFWKDGRSYVLGTVGSRYSIAISNPTSRRVEAVVSVDGLDAVDGHTASYVDKRGYILPAYGNTTVDGFRTSLDEVATFRFSSVTDSYAGRLGAARDVGVIGVAFFPELPPPPPPADLADGPRYYPRPAARRAAPSRIAPPSAEANASVAPAPSPPATTPATPAGGGADSAYDKGGAPAARAQAYKEPTPTERPGLGTEFGEARESRIHETFFARANPTTPSQVVAIRYNDRPGLLALGIAVPPPYDPLARSRELRVRETAEPFQETRFAQAPP